MPEQLTIDLGIREIELNEGGVPKKPHRKGIIYSTNPLMACARDGCDYVLKGPDTGTVVAELASYLFAGILGIPVPPYGIARYDGSVYFVCECLPINDIEDIFERRAYQNEEDIAKTIVFDIFIANPDRNMGNFVAHPGENPNRPRFVIHAIDFEKSRLLNPEEFGKFLLIPDQTYWPREELGRVLRGIRFPSMEFIGKINSLSGNGQISDGLDRVCRKVNIDREALAGGEAILTRRSQEIERLARREWR